MAKKVFLIHGWEGYPEEGWRPWLRDKLLEKGFKVFVPEMPNTKYPKMEEWVGHLTKIVGVLDENCYFVGHSLGCIAILRYLETLKGNEKVGGVVLIAGFTSGLGYEELQSFFIKLINWEKIRSCCSKFIAIHSDDDPYVSLHYSDFFKEKLGAEVIIEHNMKHFSGDDGIDELPVALDSVLRLAEN